MDEALETHDLEQEENEQILQRRKKLTELRALNRVYPNNFKRNFLAADLQQQYGHCSSEALSSNPIEVKIAGRMMTRRIMGKASFAHLQDMSGRMQVYVARDQVGDEIYQDFKNWDIGDILGVVGSLFITKTGELSIKASQIFLMTKALRPLPNKFHGLVDHEQRFRQRYLDLLMNESTRRIFLIRSKLVFALRQFFDTRGFIEVETPMMQAQAGGAAAKPFITHHNAMDMELALRIAPELFLKRLVVGGLEKVYEINRNFRNEGISTRHNPEFTMLEFYTAYADYHDLMNLTEELLQYLAESVLGQKVLSYQETSIDFSQPFKRLTLKESILFYSSSIKENQLNDLELARQLAHDLNISIPDASGLGKIQYTLFEHLVEEKLIQPTFITHFPAEVSPLARSNDSDPFVTDRFELFIGGRELANGFSELNDPDEQAERFKKQIQAKLAGDEEAMPFDEDYILALEYGLPPTAGEGIGIDRLAMLFANVDSIREVILFPLLRQKKK